MKDRAIQSLNALLSDYQVFYQKLRNYHWNVRGPFFFGLHAHFEAMYDETAGKVDELAERIAALGGRPLSTFAEYLEHARLGEDRKIPGAEDMVRNLLVDLESLTGYLREALADEAVSKDSATANLLEEMADGQEKGAWMLRSFLEA